MLAVPTSSGLLNQPRAAQVGHKFSKGRCAMHTERQISPGRSFGEESGFVKARPNEPTDLRMTTIQGSAVQRSRNSGRSITAMITTRSRKYKTSWKGLSGSIPTIRRSMRCSAPLTSGMLANSRATRTGRPTRTCWRRTCRPQPAYSKRRWTSTTTLSTPSDTSTTTTCPDIWE